MLRKNTPLFADIGHGLSIMIGLHSIPIWDTTDRPKKTKPGVLGFNVQTNSLEYWDGSSWLTARMS